MLQAIRSKASSLVVKILFGALIISFGVWGIGDIFRDRGPDTTVATVGDRKIDAQTLNQAARQEAERLRAALRGATLDPEQLKQLGIVDTALQRLINRDLVELEIRRLHLALGDDTVRQAIMSNRAFFNDAGQFDRNIYKELLAGQQMSERQFEAQMRSDLVLVQLNAAVADGATAPAPLVDALYRVRAERRIADIATLPASAVPAPAAPDDAETKDFYDKHQDDFRLPELRSFTLGLLTVDDVAAGIKIPDAKLHDEYQSRLAEFQTPEQRHLDQILLADEAKAKEAADALAAGKDFAAVAKEIADEAPDTLDLGVFKRDDLPPALADAAFALKQGETTQPVQDTLGWHILRVTEIVPATTQPFDAVKDKLAAELARDAAAKSIADEANKIDDALAGGTSFADVAQRFALKQQKVDAVDAGGKDADGKPAELPQGGDILKTAFATPSGQTSQLNDLGENGYYVLQVDKVTPATVKPLDQVRAQVVTMWQDEKRDAALEAQAKEIADQAKDGKSLLDIAKARKLATFTSAPLQRSGGTAEIPPNLVARIFQAKPGETIFARSGDGYLLAQVKDVQPGDPTKDAAQMKRLSQQLTTSLQDDLLQEYDQALRDRYPVSIDQAAVARAF